MIGIKATTTKTISKHRFLGGLISTSAGCQPLQNKQITSAQLQLMNKKNVKNRNVNCEV